jgi:hypothetical protein
MRHYSDFLFARPSFIEGVARVMDLGATLQEYNGHGSSEEADSIALMSDWRAVGDDLRRAMHQVAGNATRPVAGHAK